MLIKVLLVLLGVAVIVGLLALLRNRQHPRGSSEQRPPDSRRADRARQVAEIVAPLRRPCVLLRKTQSHSKSYLGGAPPSYRGFVWPSKEKQPLAFLACIDLSNITSIDWLPKAGLLLFFYDIEEQPWGFEPAHRSGWAVLYVPDGAAVDGTAPIPAALKPEYRLPRRAMTFQGRSLPPPWGLAPFERSALSKEDWDAGYDALESLRQSEYGHGPRHQIGGYPDPVQNADMDLECQLVSHGIDLGEGRTDPRIETLKAGASDWRLLLQLDSDDDLNVMWGDVGMIYFWVRDQQARAGDFSSVWLIMQCH